MSVLSSRLFRNIGFIRTNLSFMKMSTSASLLEGSKTKAGNRLAQEKSPYLLQHAYNPVDWFPWGEEAFEKAKKENKLIFLSVGYSTCHWCHVMEKESFESPAIGALLNEHFVSIKVDREERPDVDKMYMTFIQAISGGGGWPMSVFLTPDLKPITGGTYFPPEDKYGRRGFPSVLKYIADQWMEKRAELLNQGTIFAEAIKEANQDVAAGDSGLPMDSSITTCYNQLNDQFDQRFGGIGKEPKFPQPSNLDFLLRYHVQNRERESGKQALLMAEKTLVAMARGGIHDHIGQGFHRYSTDQKWHVPHFEKMLYDQAQLASVYTDTYQLTGKQFYAEVVRDILGYVCRDLSHPEGGFYSAEDADSYPTEGSPEKKEGAFCVWTYAQIQELLGEEEIMFRVFCQHFNVEDGGNLPPFSDPHGELKEKNILMATSSVAETAQTEGLTEERTKELLDKAKEILYQARQKRPKPHLDSKIITAWNGLMIGGFARAGMALKDEELVERARTAAEFVQKHLTYSDPSSLLRSCYTEDPKSGGILQNSLPIKGFLDDYTFLVSGLLDLWEASGEWRWLSWAEQLQDKMDALFWDQDANSAYFLSTADDPSILIRMKDDQDGAEPCSNSVAALNALRLADTLGRPELRKRTEAILSTFKERLTKMPLALPKMVCAHLWLLQSPTQIVILGRKDSDETRKLVDVVNSVFLPEKVLIVLDSEEESELATRNESLKELKMIDGKATAFVCKNFACSLPVTSAERLMEKLKH